MFQDKKGLDRVPDWIFKQWPNSPLGRLKRLDVPLSRQVVQSRSLRKTCAADNVACRMVDHLDEKTLECVAMAFRLRFVTIDQKKASVAGPNVLFH
jgi:hypothetical protein